MRKKAGNTRSESKGKTQWTTVNLDPDRPAIAVAAVVWSCWWQDRGNTLVAGKTAGPAQTCHTVTLSLSTSHYLAIADWDHLSLQGTYGPIKL